MMSFVTLVLVVVLSFVSVTALVMASGDRVKQGVSNYKARFNNQASNQLADLFIFDNANKFFIANVLALVLVPMLAHYLMGIWVVTWSLAGILFFLPGIIWARMRKKRLQKFEEQLPDAFIMMASSLQSGASLNMSIESMVKQTTPPISQEFGLLTKRLRLGVTLEDALIEMEKRVPIQSFIMASSAIRISREVGGNLVETIKGMAKTLRRKKAMEGKIDSLTSQGRMQGLFMAVLPMIMAVILSFREPEAMQKLYSTPEGLVILAIMVVMQICGFVFIRKITSIDS
jgi:tight adherence protein B